MKIWPRLLTGIAIGTLIGLFLPANNEDVVRLFIAAARVVINIGSYVVFPLVFFGALIGAYELRKDHGLGAIYGKAALATILTTAGMIVIGVISVFVLSPARIPPIFQEAPPFEPLSVDRLLLRVFPRNLFAVFTQEQAYLLPILVAAVIIGIFMTRENELGKPFVDMIDAGARIFYRIANLLMEVLGIGLIVVATAMLFRFRSITDLNIFVPLVFTLLFNTALILFGVFPLLIRLLRISDNPYMWLYAILSPALVGLASGDSFFALPALITAGNRNLGMRRRAGANLFAFTTIFAKAGTAMIMCSSFILILQSYSALEITIWRVLLVMVATFGISFVVSVSPGNGVILGLSLLSGFYGRGLEESFLIMLPLAPILLSIGALLDVVTSGFIAYIVSNSERLRKRVNSLDFV